MTGAPPKYEPLTSYLRTQRGNQIRMSFAEIERVIGSKLPPSADTHRAWWSNNPSNNVMTKAWLEAGFESEQVDLRSRKLIFRRLPGTKTSSPTNPLPSSGSPDLASGKLALFGWLQGTIVINPDVDLTEPADPEWADRTSDEDPSAA